VPISGSSLEAKMVAWGEVETHTPQKADEKKGGSD